MLNSAHHPLCSIVVLTYNRPQCLVERLNEIVPYLTRHSMECLVISNGDASDLTSIRKDFPEVSFFVNERNIGLSGSYFSAFHRSKGQFTWIISDDDLIHVEAAVKFLESEEVKAQHYISDWNRTSDKSETASDINLLAGLSNQIYMTSAAKDGIVRLGNEDNPTFPQILLSVVLGCRFSRLPFPLFTDVGVHKAYSAAAAFKVQIRDKVLLTKQSRLFETPTEWIQAIDSWTITNLLNYSFVHFGEYGTNISRWHHARRLRRLLKDSPPRIRLLIALIIMALLVWGLVPSPIKNFLIRRVVQIVNPKLTAIPKGHLYEESVTGTYPDYDPEAQH